MLVVMALEAMHLTLWKLDRRDWESGIDLMGDKLHLKMNRYLNVGDRRQNLI